MHLSMSLFRPSPDRKSLPGPPTSTVPPLVLSKVQPEEKTSVPLVGARLALTLVAVAPAGVSSNLTAAILEGSVSRDILRWKPYTH